MEVYKAFGPASPLWAVYDRANDTVHYARSERDARNIEASPGNTLREKLTSYWEATF